LTVYAVFLVILTIEKLALADMTFQGHLI